MKKFNNIYVAILVAAAVLPACKAKKKVVETPKPAVTYPADPPAPAKPETPQAPPPPPAPAPAKPNYNFSNIQFEFNSAVLKTASYQVLDQVAAEMKKDQSARFLLNGHSSAEGTPEHNMSLSVDRANSVKTYLINAGINGDNMSVKGFGESKPVSDNTTEEGRALNRRVEIKLSK
ncbi:OmpA family protein [Mucilaginibacter sp. Bleaf8]|uniref:OmpA family protein n=1 Tax=Mucilaginibacter sp. Bleaf8 TaxID=2834430 RepID=UPI001BCF2CEA|nr:OmpA family protein [Mucilaginibacter sp. Bleaf8]MBS7564065.1 OmpA family protein [Mucilaginibacter sp. Bleaf8]